MTGLHRRRRRSQNSEPGNNGILLMNLSLFIMLLAFFIVLNAISTFEELKSKPVMRSVSQTFSNQEKKLEQKEVITADPFRAVHEGETIERMDALFQAQIRSFDSVKSSTSGIMWVEMDLAEFSEAVMTVGQRTLTPSNRRTPPARFFLPTLVSVLQSDQNGTPYRMDIIMHTDENPARIQNRDPKIMMDLITQGGAYVQRLESVGMPQKLISYGAAKGPKDKITIVFRPHVPFSPLQDYIEGDKNAQ